MIELVITLAFHLEETNYLLRVETGMINFPRSYSACAILIISTGTSTKQRESHRWLHAGLIIGLSSFFFSSLHHRIRSRVFVLFSLE